MDSNPICHPSPAQKKWNAHFWITFNFWWWAGLVDGLIPHPPALSSQKNEMLNLWLCSTSDDQPGWLMDSNPICHPSPARKMKCLFLDYIHFRWLAGLVNGLEPHPPPLSSQKKWNACFWITFNFWWSAGLINGLEPHRLPLSNQKIEMLIFGLHSNSDQPGWLMDLNPIHHPSPAKKKWNVHFWITFNFWWLAGLVDGLEPHLPPLSSQKMKCSFLDYIQLLMTGRAGGWTWTPSATPLQPKKWNAHFWFTFNFWWSAELVDGLKPHLPPLSSQKNEMLIFGLLSTSDDQLGWSMHSNPICHLSPAKKTRS